MTARIKLLIITSLLFVTANIWAQGFLHTDGKRIVDGNGENFIIRSIGTGNWLLMEGYMMNTEGSAGTHTGFRNKLIETIGVANTDSFYTKWNQDHMQKIDVDSMAAWGFNAIRVAMHYKWLTLPIEDEPVPGEQTWLEDGFVILDSLLSWCSSNSMYLILDMHGAPGGQGKESGISDYDPDLPSLWESEDNKTKLVALWQKLAQRYADEPWIGGYDLINETNWTFPEGNNSKMRALYERITDSIRSVDQNHIIYIEGNWFANDFSGLTPPWDNNMVYSFHKYWGYNNANSLDWVLPLREEHNVPLWCGETGENSNTWFTNFVKLSEGNNIGWSFWPVKKPGINNILGVEINTEYQQLLNSWNNSGPALSEEEAFQAVLGFAEQHKFENCNLNYNVIDAIIRQPHTTELKSMKLFEPEDTVYSVLYALGRNGYAYFDFDTADYHLDTGEFERWNEGYGFRNDGVDIELSGDTDVSIDYSVGWTEAGEWLVYLFRSDAPMKYDCIVRSASGGSGGYLVFEADGKVISDEFHLPGTGGWYSWSSDTLKDIVLPSGDIKLKMRFTKSGSNVNYFKFTNPRAADDVGFKALYSETSVLGNDIYIHVNKDITAEEMTADDFTLSVSGKEVNIVSARVSDQSDRIIILTSSASIIYTQAIKVSYQGSSVHSSDENLTSFEDLSVRNNYMPHNPVPGKIEAEDFLVNNGFALEDCTDAGGGKNTAYANPGDYLDYLIYVPETKEYQIDFRVASAQSSARINLLYEKDGEFISLGSKTFNGTGGWQTWTTQSTILEMEEGKYIFRIQVVGGEHNLNYFRFLLPSGTHSMLKEKQMFVFPNPARDIIHIKLGDRADVSRDIELYSSNGALVRKMQSNEARFEIGIAELSAGTYFLKVIDKEDIWHQKILVY